MNSSGEAIGWALLSINTVALGVFAVAMLDSFRNVNFFGPFVTLKKMISNMFFRTGRVNTTAAHTEVTNEEAGIEMTEATTSDNCTITTVAADSTQEVLAHVD